MANSLWQRWMTELGWATRSAPKRIVRDSVRWQSASELLEGRAMLSATSLAPVPAEVDHGKASFEAPSVAGSWNISFEGGGEGTAVVTQVGTKVTAVLDLAGFPPLTMSGKFTKKNPHSISDKIKIPDRDGGKTKVFVEIEFPEVALPESFTGEINGLGEDINLTGTKVVAAAAKSAVPKAGTPFANIEGEWTFTSDSESLGEDCCPLVINQAGSTNRKVSGDFNNEEVDMTIKAKFSKVNPSELKGKATVRIPDLGSFKTKFFVTFSDEYTAFEGTATSKDGEVINLIGEFGFEE